MSVSRADGEKRIMQAVNRRVRSGRPFTTDEIWPRLKDITPGEYRSWLGNQMAEMSRQNAIVRVAWRVTPSSGQKSRAVAVWQGVRAMEHAA